MISKGIDVPLSATIEDDRLTSSADVEATLFIDVPEPKPLSSGEPHATLIVSGGGVRTEIPLDAKAVELVGDELRRIQDGVIHE